MGRYALLGGGFASWHYYERWRSSPHMVIQRIDGVLSYGNYGKKVRRFSITVYASRKSPGNSPCECYLYEPAVVTKQCRPVQDSSVYIIATVDGTSYRDGVIVGDTVFSMGSRSFPEIPRGIRRRAIAMRNEFDRNGTLASLKDREEFTCSVPVQFLPIITHVEEVTAKFNAETVPGLPNIVTVEAEVSVKGRKACIFSRRIIDSPGLKIRKGQDGILFWCEGEKDNKTCLLFQFVLPVESGLPEPSIRPFVLGVGKVNEEDCVAFCWRHFRTDASCELAFCQARWSRDAEHVWTRSPLLPYLCSKGNAYEFPNAVISDNPVWGVSLPVKTLVRKRITEPELRRAFEKGTVRPTAISGEQGGWIVDFVVGNEKFRCRGEVSFGAGSRWAKWSLVDN